VLTPAQVNGQPGMLARDADGGLIVVIALDVLDRQVQAIRSSPTRTNCATSARSPVTWHLRWNEQNRGVTPGEGAAS